MGSVALSPSVTSWQRERDSLLDHISELHHARDRATDFLARLASEVKPITKFDIGEAVAVLWSNPTDPVLDSGTLNDKEDQQ